MQAGYPLCVLGNLKHQMIGTTDQESLRKQRYFAIKQPCPFYQIGCLFSHDDEITEEPEDIETDDDYTLIEIQCHLCKVDLSSRNQLMDHDESIHSDYQQGMMEVVAQRNQSLI